MITQMTDLPDGVLGFEAKGKVTAEDYEGVLVPALDAALEGGGKIRFLYVLGEEFEGFSAGAAWDDTKVGLKHPFSFERVAIVTDHAAYRVGVEGWGFLMPTTKLRVFGTGELDAAKAWIGE